MVKARSELLRIHGKSPFHTSHSQTVYIYKGDTSTLAWLPPSRVNPTQLVHLVSFQAVVKARSELLRIHGKGLGSILYDVYFKVGFTDGL